jgi:hypothetical protein
MDKRMSTRPKDSEGSHAIIGVKRTVLLRRLRMFLKPPLALLAFHAATDLLRLNLDLRF